MLRPDVTVRRHGGSSAVTVSHVEAAKVGSIMIEMIILMQVNYSIEVSYIHLQRHGSSGKAEPHLIR